MCAHAPRKFDFKSQIFILFFKFLFKKFNKSGKNLTFFVKFWRARGWSGALTASNAALSASIAALQRWSGTQCSSCEIRENAAFSPLQNAAPWQLIKRSFFAPMEIWQGGVQWRLCVVVWKRTYVRERVFVYSILYTVYCIQVIICNKWKILPGPTRVRPLWYVSVLKWTGPGRRLT